MFADGADSVAAAVDGAVGEEGQAYDEELKKGLHASVLRYHIEATHFPIAVAFSILGELEHVKSHRQR